MLAPLIISQGLIDSDAGEIVAALNAPTVEQKNAELHSWAGIALLIGPDGAEALRLTLEASGLTWAVPQLGGKGLDLSHVMVQAMLAGFESQGLAWATVLRETGLRYVSPYVDAGGVGEVTEAEVVEALALLQLERDRDAARQAAADAYNACTADIDAWAGVGVAPYLERGV